MDMNNKGAEGGCNAIATVSASLSDPTTDPKMDKNDKCAEGESSAIAAVSASISNPTTDSMEEEVRKSIVRISFSVNSVHMVIAGVVNFINGQYVEIVAESTLIEKCKQRSFIINFPEKSGYSKDIVVCRSSLRTYKSITKFVVKYRDFEYDRSFIKKVQFGTQSLKECDDVDVFIFPREKFITPTGYWPGSIIYGNPYGTAAHVNILDCRSHEYAHCGSPVFDKKGCLVGMCHALQCHTHIWTTAFIKKLLDNWDDWKRKSKKC